MISHHQTRNNAKRVTVDGRDYYFMLARTNDENVVEFTLFTNTNGDDKNLVVVNSRETREGLAEKNSGNEASDDTSAVHMEEQKPTADNSEY